MAHEMAIGVNFVLFETPFGYALFERLQSEEIGVKLEQVQKSVEDLVKFGKTIKLKAIAPFKNAAHALENANDISEGVVNDYLKEFLTSNLSQPGLKKNSIILGIADKSLAGSIKTELGYNCDYGELVIELLRGIRLHSDKMLSQLIKDNDLEKGRLGLGHSYSRAKVKFNVNRADNMIIQAISLLDQLDKDVNTFAMRVREWYSWHFPELVKIVNDNYQYAKLAKFIKNKSELTEEQLDGLIEITGDESKAKQILDAAKSSMGTDISELDMINIVRFTDRVIELANYRKRMHEYLLSKMHNVAPNLSALIGEIVGARLISHAGSLTNLSKYPASTVQILGAEKALFRALKTKGNTPKYGLLYHSSFIGRAGTKNKGRISRFLANKCTIASRIDCFSDKPSSVFGEALKNQVEERLNFYEHGTAVTKNIDVITKAIKELDAMDVDEEDEENDNDKKAEIVLGKRKASPESEGVSPKRHKDLGSDDAMDEDEDENAESKKSTKKKKKKKSKKSNTEKTQEIALKTAESEKETKNDDSKSEEKEKYVLVVPSELESSKKKDKKEANTIQDTPKSDKKEKKEKKGEEPLTQETPKSDKKKKKKDKKEEVTISETPKSDKKKDEKNKETPKTDKKKQDSTETSKLDKKKKKKV
ncbi:Nop-domain-containing protein [Rhizophagus irregularis]|uniref:Nucleolar protein 56 n=1 Tax=Rhizophagus irregularis TaxID=588596 RepID=A0A2I1GTF1_9GLOM|nr:Nop-domain-containing protein [Rhizophagus irregularis]